MTTRFDCRILLVLVVLTLWLATAAAAQPSGTMTWGVHVTLATRWLERVTFAPIWENGFIRAFGPRVEESGLTLIQSFPYSAPLEDVRLKKQ